VEKPRVLIFGQSFNSNTGGGVTLSNLFQDWPKEKLAVTVTSHAIDNVNVSYCNKYYFLGSNENSWIFPFKYFQRTMPSGELEITQYTKDETIPAKPSLRSRFVDNIFYPILYWTGLFHVLSKISLTDDIKKWVDDFDPEVLYLQVSTRDSLHFGIALAKYLKVPVVLHQMDDWLNSVSHGGLGGSYWKRKINDEFQQLVDLSTLCLSISDQMGEEYQRRFGKKFKTYHNPVDLSFWDSGDQAIKLNPNGLTVLYAGRTGFGIGSSLKTFAQAIDEIRREHNIPIEFFIQTAEPLSWISEFEGTHYRALVPYSTLPQLFRGSDFLLLPCDFSAKSVEFLRYSMPTKAPEYMISGAVTVLLAPEETAVYKYGDSQQWALTIGKDDVELVKKELMRLIRDQELRREISERAVFLAKKNHDSHTIREKFASEFTRILREKDKASDSYAYSE
jgi:glycosyltransferase involved in cell wall biosynthesis